ncbi:MAG: polysaccharide deacetylase family protein [Prevotellaceae bacterium]|nr:polysaccharide deacetylase family protein [Prevotellaceae bacterium]
MRHTILQKIKKNIFHPKLGEILMFHRITYTRNEIVTQHNDYTLEVTPDFLEKTILKYKNAGYQFVNLYQVQKMLKRHSFFRKRFVCFTFDDGFRDNFELAYPIFKRHNCPFTIYVSIGFVDGTASVWWENALQDTQKDLPMAREQLKILANEPLCTIGSHTVSHKRLTEIPENEQFNEILESKKLLEEITGKEVVHFSYPGGFYNQQITKIVEKCGYRTATRNFGDTVRRGDNLFELNRKFVIEPL